MKSTSMEKDKKKLSGEKNVKMYDQKNIGNLIFYLGQYDQFCSLIWTHL